MVQACQNKKKKKRKKKEKKIKKLSIGLGINPGQDGTGMA